MIQIQEILDLSVEERISMIGMIWDSLDHENIKLSDAHQQELDARLARYENGETTFFSWDDIKKELNKAR